MDQNNSGSVSYRELDQDIEGYDDQPELRKMLSAFAWEYHQAMRKTSAPLTRRASATGIEQPAERLTKEAKTVRGYLNHLLKDGKAKDGKANNTADLFAAFDSSQDGLISKP
eukprot:1730565-Prymnesium_polylepis.1